MTIEEAIKKNPFDPNKGNESAYCRYLRYNVEGWYNLDSKEVLRRWVESEVKDEMSKMWKRNGMDGRCFSVNQRH